MLFLMNSVCPPCKQSDLLGGPYVQESALLIVYILNLSSVRRTDYMLPCLHIHAYIVRNMASMNSEYFKTYASKSHSWIFHHTYIRTSSDLDGTTYIIKFQFSRTHRLHATVFTHTYMYASSEKWHL